MNRSADQLYRVALDEFRRRGVRRLFVKHLARNDNDKNQIYISPDLDGIGNLLRGRLSDGSESTSVAKPQSSPGLAKMEVHLDWAWIGSDGDAVAPNTKLIYYFQYPEVRLSGFLSGCTAQSGPPIIIYGLARQWDKDMFRATLLAYFSGLSMMTLIWYFSMGLVTVKATTTAGVALLPALAVAYLGVRLKNRVNEMVFRRVVLLVIMAVGCMGLASYFLNTSG